MSSPSPLPILLFTFLWCCQADDLIADVCSKAINSSLCTQALKSDPRSRGADLRGLGQIIIEMSSATTNDTMRVVKSLSGDNNTGPIDVCMETCIDAIDDLNDCSKLLKDFEGRKSKADMQSKGSAAITNVETCDDEFEESRGGEPPEVKEASKRAKDLIDVFLVIANRL